MNHQEAMQAKTLERYLLGELDEAERAAFEEHYFSCAACAEEVVAAAKFLDHAKQPLMELVPPARRAPVASGPRWWERLLAPVPKPALAGACAALAAVAVWQGMPAGPEPEVTGSYFVTATRAAGGPRKILASPGQARVALLFNHTDTSVVRFEFTLEGPGGRTVQQFSGEAPRDTNDIQVLVPVRGLGAGLYTLRVRNADTAREVASLPFELARP